MDLAGHGHRRFYRPATVPKMPDGLVELMEGLSREVIRHNPAHIYAFCADHMNKLLEIRDGPPKKPLTREEKIARAVKIVRQGAEERRKKYDELQNRELNLPINQNGETKITGDSVDNKTEQLLKTPVQHDEDLVKHSEIEISQGPNTKENNKPNKEIVESLNTHGEKIKEDNTKHTHNQYEDADQNKEQNGAKNVLQKSDNHDREFQIRETLEYENEAEDEIKHKIEFETLTNIPNNASAVKFENNHVSNQNNNADDEKENKDVDKVSGETNKKQDEFENKVVNNKRLDLNNDVNKIIIETPLESTPVNGKINIMDVQEAKQGNALEPEIKKNENSFNTNAVLDGIDISTDAIDKEAINYSLSNPTSVELKLDERTNESYDEAQESIQNITKDSSGEKKSNTQVFDISKNEHTQSLPLPDAFNNFNNLESTVQVINNENVKIEDNTLEKKKLQHESRLTRNMEQGDTVGVVSVSIKDEKEDIGESSNTITLKDTEILSNEQLNKKEQANSEIEEVNSPHPKEITDESKVIDLLSPDPLTINKIEAIEEPCIKKILPIIGKYEMTEINNDNSSTNVNEEHHDDIQNKKNILADQLSPPTSVMHSSRSENTNEEQDSIEYDTSKSPEEILHNNMDLETAAVTIQKVFRSFLFRNRASTLEDSDIDESNNMDNDNENKESEDESPNKERRQLCLTRMDTVLQTVNEEKSLSLSTDDSSTLSSAATAIQAHVRGYLLRKRLNSNKTTSSSLVNSEATSLDADTTEQQQKQKKTVLNIHIVPENEHFLSRDESLLTSIDLPLDNSPPTTTNLHPLGYDKSEPRKQLKREDAIQSVSPPSNNSGKLSLDAESVKDLPNESTDADQIEHNNLQNKSQGYDADLNVLSGKENEDVNNSKQGPRAVEKTNCSNISSDEMDVVTPRYLIPNTLASEEKTSLLHSGEFHDVVLPTKVARYETAVVRGE